MAGYFSDEWLEQLMEKNDIVDVISSFVDLKPKGGRQWGCCPFHHEKTASFNVDTNKQFFYCFGCGEGGNVIHFIMKYERLSFAEAVEYLANRAGISMPEKTDNKKESIENKRRQRHYAISKEAALFYCHNLFNVKGAGQAYVKARGLKQQALKNFGIGLALNKEDELKNHLTKAGFSQEEMLDSGLVKKLGNRTVDMFFNRLMFPIIDVYGNVIAFGGRVLDDSLPKYINSQDSVFYNKKRHLYGLNLVRNNRNISKIILVEGYMDVVTVSNAGVPCVVASLGTSLTEEQAKLLKRFCSQVIIAYDGDSAGQKAAIRASGILKQVGITPRVVCFKDNLDPDDTIKKYGVDAFERLVDEAILPEMFEIRLLLLKYDVSKSDQRSEFAKASVKILSKIGNHLDREDVLKYIQTKTGYSYDVLAKQADNEHDNIKKENKNTKQRDNVVKKIDNDVVAKAQMLLLKIAIRFEPKLTIKKIDQTDFTKEFHVELYNLIKQAIIDGEHVDEGYFINMFTDTNKASELMQILNCQQDISDYKQAYKDCMRIINKNQLENNLQELQQRLDSQADKDERLVILKQIQELQLKLKDLNLRVQL